jgi:hypothetical protein
VLLVYVVAGIALTWPRASYLTGRLPENRDVASYVWDLWWIAHQVTHLGNPWFTTNMAAPAGIQLGFDTTMPLLGLIMTPVTLAFGPSAAFTLLTIVTPGLLCYAMYRAARLFLRSQTGAIASGGFFGLSAMLAEQDWAHLNIAAGTVFLPLTVEAAVRLRRKPGLRQALVLGAVLGGCVLVNQESAVMAGLLAVLLLAPWLIRHPSRTRLLATGAGVLAALVVASPQLIAMAQQARTGGTGVSPHLLAVTSKLYGAGLDTLFAPSQRVASYGLHGLADWSASAPAKGRLTEGMPMFGLVLPVLALGGLIACWRRRSAWLLALLFAGSAWLSLGASLWIKRQQFIPDRAWWHQVRVSELMPYTWLMRVPVLSAFREADRLAIIGLIGAALLAGAAADWLRYHFRPLIVVVAVLAVLESGWSGLGSARPMPTTLPALDGPVAADHSRSIVVDFPFGLRGGIPEYGRPFSPRALLIATADGHPRLISYTSWIPEPTRNQIAAHPFYAQLAKVQHGIPLAPARNQAGNQITPAQLAAARADAHRMGVGWVLVWTTRNPVVTGFLKATGFRFSYQADGVSVYRPGG